MRTTASKEDLIDYLKGDRMKTTLKMRTTNLSKEIDQISAAKNSLNTAIVKQEGHTPESVMQLVKIESSLINLEEAYVQWLERKIEKPEDKIKCDICGGWIKGGTTYHLCGMTCCEKCYER